MGEPCCIHAGGPCDCECHAAVGAIMHTRDERGDVERRGSAQGEVCECGHAPEEHDDHGAAPCVHEDAEGSTCGCREYRPTPSSSDTTWPRGAWMEVAP